MKDWSIQKSEFSEGEIELIPSSSSQFCTLLPRLPSEFDGMPLFPFLKLFSLLVQRTGQHNPEPKEKTHMLFCKTQYSWGVWEVKESCGEWGLLNFVQVNLTGTRTRVSKWFTQCLAQAQALFPRSTEMITDLLNNSQYVLCNSFSKNYNYLEVLSRSKADRPRLLTTVQCWEMPELYSTTGGIKDEVDPEVTHCCALFNHKVVVSKEVRKEARFYVFCHTEN